MKKIMYICTFTKDITMQIRIENTAIDAVKIIVPEVFRDERGYFSEAYRLDQFEELGLPGRFVQLNQSGSVKNVLRGLHFQWEPPMGKLMMVSKGEAFLVAVDIRKNSPTLGKYVSLIANEKNRKQLYAPASFARGFCVLSDYAEIQYLTTGVYNKEAESGIAYNDSEIGIEWPVKNPVLSGKDQEAQSLQDWLFKPESNNFHF
jgi:dTDP-4-dehydrorhamnose 3,5-epimerase